jgi:hypothetical protein
VKKTVPKRAFSQLLRLFGRCARDGSILTVNQLAVFEEVLVINALTAAAVARFFDIKCANQLS